MIVKGLHIEPTNICTLKCPRCARTTFIEKFKQKSWINTNLDLSALKSFLDIPLRNVTVTLCGNYGDPIYYEHLFDLIQFIKQQCGIVVLVTNGSYNKQDWWVKLTSFLSSEDKIIFSVDGVPENLTMYRKNADWQSILAAMKIVASSSIYSSWKYIPFSFNI